MVAGDEGARISLEQIESVKGREKWEKTLALLGLLTAG